MEASQAGARLTTPVTVLPTPEAIGEHLADRLLSRLTTGKRFLLGCPTGRTPRPFYDALARRRADLSRVVFVMMDEYLSGGRYATRHSCHDFVERHIREPLGVREEDVWFPDASDPEAYDSRIADAGGIDFFFLASGASDGHVAFNPPGTPRDSRTRIVTLSDETRRDNLKTFPDFGSLENVPRQGVSVGIDTIVRAREAVMVVCGESKRLSLQRIIAASHYDPAWPATVIHECEQREIVCDRSAASVFVST